MPDNGLGVVLNMQNGLKLHWVQPADGIFYLAKTVGA